MADLEGMLPDIAEVINVDTGMDAILIIFASQQYDPVERETTKVAETRHAVKISPPTEINNLELDTKNTRSRCLIDPDIKPSIDDKLEYDSVTYRIVQASAIRVPGGDIAAYSLTLEL